MDQMPLLALLLQSVPESILLISLGLCVVGRRLLIGKIIPLAFLSSVISWLVRQLPLPFGVHTLIGVLVLFAGFVLVFRIDPLKALFATFFPMASLAAVEVALLPLLTRAVGLSGFQEAWGNPWLRIVLAWPELLILALLLWVCQRTLGKR